MRSSPVGNQASLIGLGGSALLQLVDNSTVARIESGAMVHTGTGDGGGLAVTSAEDVSSLNLAQAGGASGVFGLSGSATLVAHGSTTHANLEGGVQVTGGPVAIQSRSDVSYSNIAGSSMIAGMVGIGISAAATRVHRDTAAFVGDEPDSTGAGSGGAGSMIAATGLRLEARNTGAVRSVSVAGAIVDEDAAEKSSGIEEQPPARPGTPAPGGPPGGSSGSPASGPKSKPAPLLPASVGIAGAVSFNEVVEAARSYIDTAAIIALAGGALTLESLDDTAILAVTGSVALASLNLLSVGLAGSFSTNLLDATTESFVAGARVVDAGVATLDARRQGSVRAITIAAAASLPESAEPPGGSGGGGTAPPAPSPATTTASAQKTQTISFTVDAAGSFSMNQVGGTTRASISDGSVQAQALSLTATDSSLIEADGGGVAIALAKAQQTAVGFAAGLSVAVNAISSTVTTYLDHARVTAGETDISASDRSEIVAWTIAGAPSGTISPQLGLSFSGVGAGSGNYIADTVDAHIKDSVVLAGGLALKAEDDARITARSIVIALAAQIAGEESVAISMGGSATVNEIGNVVDASIDGSVVTADRGIALLADESSTISAISVGAAFAAALSGGNVGVAGAGAGSASSNSIADDVSATVKQSSLGAGTSGVSVRAEDTSTADADAGGGALAVSTAGEVSVSIALGIVIAENKVSNRLAARVDDSRIDSAGGVVIASTSRGDTQSVAAALASSLAVSFPFAVAFSGAGAYAGNTITNTIDAAVTGGSVVSAAGDVLIDATDDSTADAVVTAVATAGGIISAAIGASVTLDTIDNRVAAFVDGSRVTSAHGELTITADADSDVSATSVAAAVVYGLLAVGGATATTNVLGSVDAHARDATLSSGGATRILASSDSSSSASAVVADFGLVAAIAVLVPSVHVGGSTRAFVDGASSVSAASLDVHDTSTNVASLPLGLSLAIGAIGGAGAGATARVDHTTEA